MLRRAFSNPLISALISNPWGQHDKDARIAAWWWVQGMSRSMGDWLLPLRIPDIPIASNRLVISQQSRTDLSAAKLQGAERTSPMMNQRRRLRSRASIASTTITSFSFGPLRTMQSYGSFHAIKLRVLISWFSDSKPCEVAGLLMGWFGSQGSQGLVPKVPIPDRIGSKLTCWPNSWNIWI